MTFRTRKHVANAVATGVAAAALYMATPAAAFTTGVYDLFNHPDGHLTSDSPPINYGLRLDAICKWICGSHHSDDEKTFSVESSLNVSSVWLDWGLGDTDYTKAKITGTLYYNDASSDYDDEWTITYNLYDIQSLSGADPTAGDAGNAVNGWYVDDDDITGTLVRVDDGKTFYLKGKNNGDGMAFVFDDDGHRCNYSTDGDENYGDPSMCDSSHDGEVVARGWTKVKKHGSHHWKADGTNDWLVIAKPKDDPPGEIPEPGTVALFGLGLVGLSYARRRRRTMA